MRDGEFDFEFRGHAVTGAAARLVGDGLDDLRMRVTENQRAPGTNVIDVFVAIGVPQARACRVIDNDRIAADGAKGAHGAVYAADQHFRRAAKISSCECESFHFLTWFSVQLIVSSADLGNVVDSSTSSSASAPRLSHDR